MPLAHGEEQLSTTNAGERDAGVCSLAFRRQPCAAHRSAARGGWRMAALAQHAARMAGIVNSRTRKSFLTGRHGDSNSGACTCGSASARQPHIAYTAAVSGQALKRRIGGNMQQSLVRLQRGLGGRDIRGVLHACGAGSSYAQRQSVS